jgi:hypothetical protein
MADVLPVRIGLGIFGCGVLATCFLTVVGVWLINWSRRSRRQATEGQDDAPLEPTKRPTPTRIRPKSLGHDRQDNP